jgi:hypothetical protein
MKFNKPKLSTGMLCLVFSTLLFSCKKVASPVQPNNSQTDTTKINPGSGTETTNYPIITTVFPLTAGSGEYLILKGKYLIANGKNPDVTINDRAVTIDKVTSDSLRILVPKMVGSGHVLVTTSYGNSTNRPNFTYKYKVTVTTIAGTGAAGAADGPGKNATFKDPWGITTDTNGDLYIADCYNRLIRKISAADNTVTSITIPIYVYQQNFGSPYNINLDPKTHTLFVTDFNQNVLKINPDNSQSLIYTGNSTTTGVAVGPDGNVYISNNIKGTIMRISPSGKDTAIITAGLFLPRNLFFKDNILHVNTSSGLFKIDNSGNKSLVFFDKNFRGWEMISDSYGNFYGADNENNNIRMIEKNGNSIVIAGNGALADVDGVGLAASFNGPAGIAIDASGAIYVSTYNFTQNTGNKIRKIVIE